MKALVTGANGFIGRHLVQRLCERDFEVFCLVRKTSNLASLDGLDCQYVYADVGRGEGVAEAVVAARPDVVFHLAGLTKAIKVSSLYEANADGTRHLLMALSELKTSPVTIVVSTLAAAGPSSGRAKVESDPCHPVSNYGKSKLAGENVAREFADRLPLTVVRPPIVFGPHDRDTFEMFKTISKAGLHPVPRRMSVSWIQVLDVCEALIAVSNAGSRMDQNDVASGVYFATSQEIVDYGELGRMIGGVLNRSVRPIGVPSPAVWALATINEAIARIRRQPNIFNFDKAREATAGSWICDGSKLEADTGFRPTRTLPATLEASADWYKRAGWL